MLKLKQIEGLLFFLTILFLPTQLGRHFWPNFSYIYSLKVDYLSPTIYFWDLLAVILIAVFMIQKKKVNRAALNLFLFFILTQVLSLVAASLRGADPSPGLVRLEQYLLTGLFGVYLASQNFSKIKNILFYSLSLAVIFESVLAFLQVLKGASIGFWILGERTFSLSSPGIAKFDFYGNEFLRPYATFPHPNVFAGFVLIALLLMPARRALAILGGLILLLTVSRATIAAAFISAMFVLKAQGRKLVIIISILLLPILYTRYSSIFSFDNLTLLRREELAFTAFNLWLTHPLFGVGLNNFIPIAANSLLTGPSRFLQPVHNIFLLALSETGVIGVIGVIGLIGWPIVKCKVQSEPLDFARDKKGKVLLLIWGVIIFLGMFDHYFLTLPQGYRLLFLLWGLSISMLE